MELQNYFENDKTKKNRRVKNLNYDTRSCRIMHDKSVLQELKKIYNLKPDSKNGTITLLPYCNEELKHFWGRQWPRLDQVNRPSIPKEAVKTMVSMFGVDIETKDPITDIGSIYTSPPSEPNAFLTMIKEWIFQHEQKKVLVVSHSSFMVQLAHIIFTNVSELYFDNLDMLRIDYDKDGNIIHGCMMRWPTYEYCNDMNTYKQVFLMRHCVACHNSDDIGLFTKAFYSSSGRLSLCLPETSEEIGKARDRLVELFPISETCFASSVIFRALLTVTLILCEIQKNV